LELKGGLEMPGPLPKNPVIRQRRNKSSSRAVLTMTPENRMVKKPNLPRLDTGEEWHPMARKFWEDIWESPMSAEFTHGDEPALFRLVFLVNAFWKKPNLAVSKEISSLEKEFGLTPMSRRRLEWTVAQSEEAKGNHEMNRANRAKKMIDSEFLDPRGALD
jgi:hypothetical protein